jgi:tyrosine-protein kinase Etk/Wzc
VAQQQSERRNYAALLAEIESSVTKMCPDYVEFETSLRQFVSRYLSREKPHSTVLGIISPGNGDGRTTVAVGLAGALAEIYASVVLVEMAESGGLAEELLLPLGPGLHEYVASSDLELDAVLRKSSSEKLWFLPIGASHVHRGNLDAIARTRSLLAALRSRFEITVVDLPPMMKSEKAPALIGQMDAAVVLAEAGKTRLEDISRTVELCGTVPIRGLLLNRFEGLPAWLNSLVDG